MVTTRTGVMMAAASTAGATSRREVRAARAYVARHDKECCYSTRGDLANAPALAAGLTAPPGWAAAGLQR
eukprot:4706780-Prymnesium_polylepis.1